MTSSSGTQGKRTDHPVEKERGRSADDAPVEDDPSLPDPEDFAERVNPIAPVLDDVEEPRADQAADEDPGRQVVDHLGIEPLAAGPPRRQVDRGEEGQEQHRAVAENLDPAQDRDREQDLPHALCLPSGTSGPAYSIRIAIIDQPRGPDPDRQQGDRATARSQAGEGLERLGIGDLGIIKSRSLLGFYRLTEDLSNPLGIALAPGHRGRRARAGPAKERPPPGARPGRGIGSGCSWPGRPARGRSPPFGSRTGTFRSLTIRRITSCC